MNKLGVDYTIIVPFTYQFSRLTSNEFYERYIVNETGNQLRDRLAKARRRHLGAGRRAIEREVRLPDESSFALAQELLAGGRSPAETADREELARRIRQALVELPEADRDILILRDYEGLTYEEAAYILQIEPAAARKRHGRALVRLHKLLRKQVEEACHKILSNPVIEDYTFELE